jgi:hypothetical protein
LPPELVLFAAWQKVSRVSSVWECRSTDFPLAMKIAIVGLTTWIEKRVRIVCTRPPPRCPESCVCGRPKFAGFGPAPSSTCESSRDTVIAEALDRAPILDAAGGPSSTRVRIISDLAAFGGGFDAHRPAPLVASIRHAPHSLRGRRKVLAGEFVFSRAFAGKADPAPRPCPELNFARFQTITYL